MRLGRECIQLRTSLRHYNQSPRAPESSAGCAVFCEGWDRLSGLRLGSLRWHRWVRARKSLMVFGAEKELKLTSCH